MNKRKCIQITSTNRKLVEEYLKKNTTADEDHIRNQVYGSGYDYLFFGGAEGLRGISGDYTHPSTWGRVEYWGDTYEDVELIAKNKIGGKLL